MVSTRFASSCEVRGDRELNLCNSNGTGNQEWQASTSSWQTLLDKPKPNCASPLIIFAVDELPDRGESSWPTPSISYTALKPLSPNSRNDPGSQLFDGLSEAEIKAVLAKATNLEFRRHSVAINQAHPADRMYRLTQGRARFFVVTHDGRKIILHWIVPGDVFGAAAICHHPSFYLTGVEMTQDSTALMWTRSTIRNLVARYPRLLENAVLILESYLEWYVATHESLVTHDAGERLARLLIRLSKSIGAHVSGGIQLDVRNEELANAANMTAFTVSRWLKKWQQCGALTKGRNRLVLQSRDLLLNNIDPL